MTTPRTARLEAPAAPEPGPQDAGPAGLGSAEGGARPAAVASFDLLGDGPATAPHDGAPHDGAADAADPAEAGPAGTAHPVAGFPDGASRLGTGAPSDGVAAPVADLAGLDAAVAGSPAVADLGPVEDDPRTEPRVARLHPGGSRPGRTVERAARPEPGSPVTDDRPGDRFRSPRRSARRAAAPDTAAPDTTGRPADPARSDTAGPPPEPGSRATRPRRPPGPKQIDPDADPVVAAREICLRLLTDRARTRKELGQALARRGVPDEAAHTVLERFDEVGLIDDAAFAGQWVRSRHRHRGLARRAIAQELRRKGVDDETAGEALAEVDDGSEERRARELVDRRLRTMPADTPEQRTVAARKLVGMLARKGYGAGTAYGVVREALAAHGAETDELGEPPAD